jgi:hypothetical protein
MSPSPSKPRNPSNQPYLPDEVLASQASVSIYAPSVGEGRTSRTGVSLSPTSFLSVSGSSDRSASPSTIWTQLPGHSLVDSTFSPASNPLSCSLALAQDTATPASLSESMERAEDAVRENPTSTEHAASMEGRNLAWSEEEPGVAGNDVSLVEGSTTDDLRFEDFVCGETSAKRLGKTVSVPVVLTIRGKPTTKTKFFELRAFCIRAGIKAYKNKTKTELLEMIAQKVNNNKVYDPIFNAKMAERGVPVAKQIQCPFRLVNVIFSGRFAARFAALFAKRTRADLDAPVSAEDKFWKDVLVVFLDNTPCEELDNLTAAHPALDPANIDPSDIVQHTVRQLRQIWGSTHGAYRKAHIRYTTTGTNGADFYEFCEGRVDALYVHLHLDRKPELVGAVNRELPDDVFFESSGTSQHESSPAVNNKRKSDVADAIRDFGNQPWREALAVRKMEAEELKLRLLENKEKEKLQYLRERSQREANSAALQDYIVIGDRLQELYTRQSRETSANAQHDIAEEIKILSAKKRKIGETM